MIDGKKLKPYREKTPVLCIFEMLVVEHGITLKRKSSLMVQVEFPDQVEDEFHRQVRERYFKHAEGRSGGRMRLLDWQLLKVLTPNGNKV